MESILNTLICPITLEIIEDPVQLPCCGKSVSRQPLKSSLEIVNKCPLCRGDLSNFDINNAPTNRTLSSIIDSIKSTNVTKVIKDHQWSSTFEWLEPKNPYIGKLSLNIIRSNFQTKKSIFMAVVDKSGSMSNGPIEQVKIALEHIIGLTSVKASSIETRIILYSSTANNLLIMKDKIIFLIIGILFGAIISTGSIYFYTLTATSSNNPSAQQSPQMPGTPPSGDGSTFPNMPTNNSQSN